jgi:hypothetical protein
VMVSSLNNVFTFRNPHKCLQCMAYQARGGSNFSRQMTLAFRMQKPMAKESGECVVRGIPGIIQFPACHRILSLKSVYSTKEPCLCLRMVCRRSQHRIDRV